MANNIHQKMLAVISELTAVAKNLSVGDGRSSYKAVGEADVLAAVRPLEVKHGIYSYPATREVIREALMETEREYKGNVTKSQKQFLRVKTTYRFVNVDDPEDFIETVSYGDGVDPQDKAPGKAMTYSDKYALLKAYKIITGEDPDQFASESGTFKDEGRQLATFQERKVLYDLCQKNNVNYDELLAKVGCNDPKQLTKAQRVKALERLNSGS